MKNETGTETEMTIYYFSRSFLFLAIFQYRNNSFLNDINVAFLEPSYTDRNSVTSAQPWAPKVLNFRVTLDSLAIH